MAKQRFEFEKGKSKKFWQISQTGKKFTVQFGRLGIDGQTKTKEFSSSSEAKAAAEKLISEKLRKGYSEVTTSVRSGTKKKATAATQKKRSGQTKATKKKKFTAPKKKTTASKKKISSRKKPTNKKPAKKKASKKKPAPRKATRKKATKKKATSITTRPPRINILDIIPKLKAQAKTTVRLHPRRKQIADPAASKIGGQFLWPADEPWPYISNPKMADWYRPNELPRADDQIPLVRVLQLRKDEFPEMKFFPRTDIFQLLWCPAPAPYSKIFSLVEPYVFWRSSKKVTEVMPDQPELGELRKFDSLIGVAECELNPERVTEYPSFLEIDSTLYSRYYEWAEQVDMDELSDGFDQYLDAPENLYQFEFSVADGCKVGGYVNWGQDVQIPKCKCKSDMTYLLSMVSPEFDGGTWRRWSPIEVGNDIWRKKDRSLVVEPVFNDESFYGHYHIFVCRKCRNWPVRSVFQR